MHYKLLNPSRFLGAADLLGAEPTYKILGVVMEEIEEDVPKGQPPKFKRKGLVRLEGAEKGWLLNVTNAKALATMFGEEVEKWTGHRVTLCSEIVTSFGETAPAVRVRGSPDISGPMSFTVKRRKKKDVSNLVKTSGTSGHAKPSAPPDPAKSELIRVRMAIKELLKANDMAGDVALAFVQRITGKASRHDANDLGLIQTALAAPPPSAAPPPPGEDDIPF